MIEVFSELGRFAYLDPVGFAVKYRERFFFSVSIFSCKTWALVTTCRPSATMKPVPRKIDGGLRFFWKVPMATTDGLIFSMVSQILRLRGGRRQPKQGRRYSLTQAKDEKFSFTSNRQAKSIHNHKAR